MVDENDDQIRQIFTKMDFDAFFRFDFFIGWFLKPIELEIILEVSISTGILRSSFRQLDR